MIKAVNRRLAAAGHARQLRVSARADRAANAVDRQAGNVWQRVLALIRERPGWAEAQTRAQWLFRLLRYKIGAGIGYHLYLAAVESHRAAVRDLRRAVPAKLLAKAAILRLREERDGNHFQGGGLHADNRLECGAHAAERPGGVRDGLGAAGLRPRAILEDETGQPGWELTLTDLLKLLGLTPPAAADTGPAAEIPSLRDLSALLFPAPTPDEIARVVYASGWQDRLAAASRLAPPAQMASLLAAGLAAGKSQQQIARDLLPAVEGVRASARRVARTEALRVAGAMQMAAHEALGDLVIGYRAHAVIDEHSRPWHAARSGTIYYKNPGPGQKGLDKMPRPPDEPPDASERPPGTPQTAWNCRCTLFPVLRDPSP